jgi:uncharacterized RDD family membrane protein YckC
MPHHRQYVTVGGNFKTTKKMEQQNENEYPSLLKRLQSSVIDGIVILVAMVAFAQFSSFPTFLRVSLLASLLLYEPICISFGCTLGNYLLGLRVRKNANETRRINFLQAVLRYITKLFLGWISFLTIHSNPKRRAIHDMVAGSVMIKLS